MSSPNALVLASETPLFAAEDAATASLPDAADVVAAIVASLRWIVACIVLLSLGAFGIYELQTPVYTSVARVLVQTDQLGAPSFLSGITPYRDSQIPEAANRRLETEMALLASQSNALEIVRTLAVTDRQLPSTPIAQGRRWLHDHTSERIREWFAFGARPRPSKAQTDALTAEALLANLSVEPVRSKTAETTSNVLEVKLKTVDATLAPRLLNALLDAYLQSSGGKSQLLGTATTALLDQQVAEAATQLERLEADFLRLANRTSSRSDGSVPSAAIDPGNSREASRAGNETAVTQLTNEVVELQAKYEEQRMSFTDDAPSVRALRDRLAAARAHLSSTLRTSAADSLDLSRLERQRNLVQDRYVELRRKRDQISLFTQLNPSSIDGREVVDAPTVPDPLAASKSKVPLVLGPLAGAVLGLLVAAVRELMNQRLRTARDVERALGVPTLGRLPRMDRKKVLAVRVATLSRPELKALSRP